MATLEAKAAKGQTFWRWVFLCSITALTALLVFMFIQVMRGAPHLDFSYSPVRAGFTAAVFATTCIFQLFVSPFFFRHLGRIAVVSWLLAIVAAVWSAWPAF